jgi:MOSC domain-containing protein YiiM
MTDSPATLESLMANTARPGKVVWIGLRPERRAPMEEVSSAEILCGKGLVNDHYSGNGKRQVTLLQQEHLAAIASYIGRQDLHPALLRRNIVVQGINLLSLKDRNFVIGNVVMQMSGLCQPCSLMEQVLGKGGYNAMRGHGGITARVLTDGIIHLGDSVQLEPRSAL